VAEWRNTATPTVNNAFSPKTVASAPHRAALQERADVFQTADLEIAMKELDVGTKMIESAMYDRESSMLLVRFRSWHIEEFAEVPESVVSAWRISNAPDEFFDAKIRRRFASRRLGQLKTSSQR
jgi:hypothetical protein